MFKTNDPICHSCIDKIRYGLILIIFLCAMPLLHGIELVIPDGTVTITDS